MKLKEKYNALSERLKLMLVRKNWRFIKYIRNQSEPLQILAIECSNMWETIKYLHNPTQKVQLKAVRQNWRAIQCMPNASEVVKLEAVRQNWRASEYLNPLSKNLKLAIARSKKKEESILAAVKQPGFTIKYVE